MRHVTRMLVSALLFAGATAMAHADRAHSASKAFDAARVEPTPFGEQGNPKKVTRTIQVVMTDRMRFEPALVTVRKGETIRFVSANKGAILHEMVLGTPQTLQEHAKLMIPGHFEAGMVGKVIIQ